MDALEGRISGESLILLLYFIQARDLYEANTCDAMMVLYITQYQLEYLCFNSYNTYFPVNVALSTGGPPNHLDVFPF